MLSYATTAGRTLLDRELYLPQEWTTDWERCRQAGIHDTQQFATKPALAQQVLARTFAAGVTLAWVSGDSVYGDDRGLRRWLEHRPQAYVLAVTGKESVWVAQRQRRVKTILASLPAADWQRLSAGAGSKGERWYEWQRLNLSDPAQPGWQRWLLVRRSLTAAGELRACVAFGRADASLDDLVRVAGMRWTVEQSIQTAKGEVGVDHYEVRSWTGWYRHVTLAMGAQAFLTVVRAERGTAVGPPKRG